MPGTRKFDLMSLRDWSHLSSCPQSACLELALPGSVPVVFLTVYSEEQAAAP
jgi:hypothetical protein